MISKDGSDINLSDIVLNLGAVLLAAASAGFATFVVLSGPHPIVPITADGATFQITTQTGQGLDVRRGASTSPFMRMCSAARWARSSS